MEDLGIYDQLLPRTELYYEQFMIWDKVRIIFNKLGGLKNPEYLTSSQFQKLARYPGMTNQHPDPKMRLVKAQYSLMYTEIVRKNETGLMSMEDFFTAVSIMSTKLGDPEVESKYENLVDLVDKIETALGIESN